MSVKTFWRLRVFIKKLIVVISIICLAGCITSGKGSEKRVGSTDYLEPSVNPPGGIEVSKTPMFVSIGFDDNGTAGELEWIREFTKGLKNSSGSGNSRIYDGEKVSLTFFNNGKYASNAGSEWKKLYDDGHEIGNHSTNHRHGATIDWSTSPAKYEVVMSREEWREEIVTTDEILVEEGIEYLDILGFRNPFLEYTNESISQVHELGFLYDCSIEEGYQQGMGPKNMFWPYTLDNGSPGNVTAAAWKDGQDPIASYPGLWELPAYILVIPPDELSEKYEFEPGLRDKINEYKPYIKGSDWKVTGFDYNIWYTDSGEDMLNGAEFLAILKYNFDQRLEGNRAPFMFGAHTDYYTTDEKREAIEKFLEYVLTKEEVRVVSFKKILDWIRNPVSL